MSYNKIYNYIIIVLLGLLVHFNLQAQHTTSLKINNHILTIEEVTSNSNNKIMNSNERIENYKANDRKGFGMTVMAMGVVFTGLIGLYLLFNLIGISAVSLSHKRAIKTGVSKEEAKGITQRSGDIYAAIAMAIYEATELEHDEENAILTIKNTVRNYSPWSSKIYTLRETPKR
jgi:Na+-transporting methylmalonyl-CoA/oxaloacetate decarboxylase gamma subunit